MEKNVEAILGKMDQLMKTQENQGLSTFGRRSEAKSNGQRTHQVVVTNSWGGE